MPQHHLTNYPGSQASCLGLAVRASLPAYSSAPDRNMPGVGGVTSGALITSRSLVINYMPWRHTLTEFPIGGEFFGVRARPINPLDIVRYRVDLRGLPPLPGLVAEEEDIDGYLAEPFSTEGGVTKWSYRDLEDVVGSIKQLRADFGANGHAETLFQERDEEDRSPEDWREFRTDTTRGIAALDALESALKRAYPRVVARAERGL